MSFLNGQRQEVEAETVTDLVSELRVGSRNDPGRTQWYCTLRSEWGADPLSNEDRLEVLRVAAGG